MTYSLITLAESAPGLLVTLTSGSADVYRLTRKTVDVSGKITAMFQKVGAAGQCITWGNAEGSRALYVVTATTEGA